MVNAECEALWLGRHDSVGGAGAWALALGGRRRLPLRHGGLAANEVRMRVCSVVSSKEVRR